MTKSSNTSPTRDSGAYLTPYRVPMCTDHSIRTLLCKDKWWSVPTTRMQNNTDPGDGIYFRVMGCYSTGAILPVNSPERTAMRKINKMRPKLSSHLLQFWLCYRCHRWERGKSNWFTICDLIHSWGRAEQGWVNISSPSPPSTRPATRGNEWNPCNDFGADFKMLSFCPLTRLLESCVISMHHGLFIIFT